MSTPPPYTPTQWQDVPNPTAAPAGAPAINAANLNKIEQAILGAWTAAIAAATPQDLTAAATEAKARASHTGTQTSATISDFTEAVQDAVAALLGAGSNVIVNYNDAANSLTISATGSGGAGLDAEQVRDVIGVAIVGLGPVAVVVNDAADTITITTTATVNSTDAQLRERSSHTGTQPASTITGLATVATSGAYADLTGGPAIAGVSGLQDALDAKATPAQVTSALAGKADLVGGLVPTGQLPALSLTSTVVVASQAAMLALSAAEVQPGDLAVRTDGAGTFVLTAPDPSQLASWTRLNAPTDVVTSVAGQVGTVVLGKADVGLGSVDNTADVDKPLSTPQSTALTAFGTRYQQVWRPSTPYTAGAVVVSPTGRLVSAKATFTSGTTYDAASWTVVSDASYLLRPTAAGNTGQVPTLAADGTLIYANVGARVVVEHAAVSNVIRPTTSGPVTWIGSVRPQNWIDGDDWYEASATTTPDLPTTNLVNYWRASDLGMAQGDAVTTLANRVSGGPALSATGGPVFDLESGTASVLLDGVDDHLSETTTSLAQPNTVVYVGRMVVAAASKPLVSAASTVHTITTTSASKWSANAATSLPHTLSIDVGWHVIAAVFNGASTIIYVDGVAVTGAGGANGRTGTRVGSNSGLTTFTNMKVAAVAQYSTAMTVADLDALRVTLKQRYPVLP